MDVELHFFEMQLGWRGLLFEADPNEFRALRANRPRAIVYEGAVCPRHVHNLSFGVSRVPGWSGAVSSYEPTRVGQRLRTAGGGCGEGGGGRQR